MDPFNQQFFNSLGFFGAYSHQKSRVALNNQAGGHCCWIDSSDWWIFCQSFLLLEIPIEQIMEGFLGWVTKVVADLLDWVVGVQSLVVDEGGSLLQVVDFVSVPMQFLLVCGGSGFFALHLAEKYWPSY